MCKCLLCILLLLVLASSALCSAPQVTAVNDGQLVAGLVNPAVNEVVLLSDIVLQASTWSAYDAPVGITRNVTIKGGSSTRLLVLDLNYVPCMANLLPGVTLTLENLEIRRARRGLINKVDLVCQSYQALVLLKGVAIHALTCVPRIILFDPKQQLPRPEGNYDWDAALARNCQVTGYSPTRVSQSWSMHRLWSMNRYAMHSFQIWAIRRTAREVVHACEVVPEQSKSLHMRFKKLISDEPANPAA